ncbi:SFM1 [Symbiodinium natans]|uniref:SFM1 protein n=1 Tax=Symbiodinium natans TaxID=878477 RepID=A0A812JEM5_9DINO|nr:SFM1 [Symbiodinium natans]
MAGYTPTCFRGLEQLVPAGGGAATAEPGGLCLPPWDRICLLDMDAEEVLQPDDVAKFDAFVFGGILGNVIENDDGSYGSDDRTSEIRPYFKHRRHLGPMQMTTDTAVLVAQKVLERACPLAEIPFLDSPEFERPGDGKDAGAAASDSVCMEGFRYVARRGDTGDWEPTLPEGMKELLLTDADNDILSSLQ